MEDADGTGPTASDFPIDVEDTDDRLRLADQLLAPVLDQFVLGAGSRGGCDLAQLQERLFLGRLLLGHVDQVALVGREFETAEGGVGVDAAVDVELGQVPAVQQPAFPPDLQTLERLGAGAAFRVGRLPQQRRHVRTRSRRSQNPSVLGST